MFKMRRALVLPALGLLLAAAACSGGNAVNKPQADRGKFDQFLAARQTQPAALPQSERDRLFQEFLQWTKARERR